MRFIIAYSQIHFSLVGQLDPFVEIEANTTNYTPMYNSPFLYNTTVMPILADVPLRLCRNVSNNESCCV